MAEVEPAVERAASPAPDRAGWGLLAVLVVLAGLLATVVVHADIDRFADEGWQDNAVWAAGMALVLLGLGLGAVTWSFATPELDSTFSRVPVLAAVIGTMLAVIVVGIADHQGGERVTSQPLPSPSTVISDGDDESSADVPLGAEDALDPDQLVSTALPIDVRTAVTVDLTRAGRNLVAAAMRCQPRDFRNRSLAGVAIGGTWAQPLLVLSAPFDEEGDAVIRCREVMIRLPITAGTIRPF